MTTYYDRIVPENVIRLSRLALGPEDPHPTGVKWSGSLAIPAIGDRVLVKVNGMGLGTVTEYFVEPESENGYLGVKVVLDNPPAWHEKQNPGKPWCLVFGAEIAPVPA